jgi:protein phosphatase-4 regulatory subunit 3
VATADEPSSGSASAVVKPLVDYPDDDDEDIMDTKPEGAEQQPVASPTEAFTEVPALSPTQTPPAPPERLAEKRRREEEDDDELSKLTAGPKRRSSTGGNSGAFNMNRKKNMSAGSLADKNASPGVLNKVTSAAPKRIAINIGSTAKPPVSETDTPRTEVTSESYEKENRDDSQGNEGG